MSDRFQLETGKKFPPRRVVDFNLGEKSFPPRRGVDFNFQLKKVSRQDVDVDVALVVIIFVMGG